MCERRGRVPLAFAACESAEPRSDATTFSSDCHRRGKTQMMSLCAFWRERVYEYSAVGINARTMQYNNAKSNYEL
jgi:hypothetical protein